MVSGKEYCMVFDSHITIFQINLRRGDLHKLEFIAEFGKENSLKSIQFRDKDTNLGSL